MQILITGGMGFIGRAVTRKLIEAGVDSICILDNLLPQIHGPSAAPHDFGSQRVRFFKGDVTRRDDLEPLLLSADAVLHLAAETGTGQSMYQVEHYIHVNVAGTALLLDILTNKRHHVSKFVVASSRAVYGEGKYSCAEDGIVFPLVRLEKDMENGDFETKCPVCGQNAQRLPTSEDSWLHPISIYGFTKQSQEAMAMMICKNIGIAPVALRYQNVYGPGQSLSNPYTGILSIFSNRFREGKPVNIFEDGQESRDFVFIDDVAEATVKALMSGQSDGEILNVGSGLPVNVLDMAQKLRELFAVDVEINVSGHFRAGDIRHNFADLEKVERILGWRPQTSFEKGLNEFVDWVKGQDLGLDLYDKAIGEMHEKGLYKSSRPV
jgi:dTDP-L-rhamnose 4-epimerase